VISVLAYAPRPTPLGRAAAWAAAIHLTSFAAIAFVVSNPIVLGGCALAVVIAGLAAGARAALMLAARWGAALGIVIVAVNALASQRGDTILVRGADVPVLGTLDVTAEALAEGSLLALRIAIVFAAFAVHTACVDPDRLLRLARPLARRSALTATLIARLAPLAATDHARVREAAALRGPGAAPVGRVAVLRRLVAGSLDRAVDVAATLELRGYTGDAPGRPDRRPRAPGDLAFACSGLVALGLVASARLAGIAGYESYPRITIDADPPTLALAAALPAAALAPIVLDRLRSRRIPALRYAYE
jgi:energy-coupling factor transport system permease protein